MFLFYFSSPHHHLHLHSFPTRRSSDLSTARPITSRPATGYPSGKSSGSPTTASSIFTFQRPTSCSRVCRTRSEEHTSELQSHSDLVCRLLLEKKKTIITLTQEIV